MAMKSDFKNEWWRMKESNKTSSQEDMNLSKIFQRSCAWKHTAG